MNKMLVTFICVLICANVETHNQKVVDNYIKYIQERREKALKFEFPNDARMHEAYDKKIRGTYYFVLNRFTSLKPISSLYLCLDESKYVKVVHIFCEILKY